MKKAKSVILMVGLMLSAWFVSCSTATADKQAQAGALGVDSTRLELPLPKVPSDLKDAEARAAYVLLHFWDALEFADTLRSLNDDFVEQNFANFVSLFPIATAESRGKSVERLMARASSTPAAYVKMMGVASKYLYDPNSPMYDEDYYGLFVGTALSGTVVDEAQRLRLESEREWIAKNRAGMRATDFRYVSADGTVMSLLDTPVREQMILVLYDPDCDHCHDIISAMAGDARINEGIASGALTVLAINFTGEENAQGEAERAIPSNWRKGRDLSGIEDRELYVIRATPSIYVLDSDHMIVAKDITPAALLGASRE